MKKYAIAMLVKNTNQQYIGVVRRHNAYRGIGADQELWRSETTFDSGGYLEACRKVSELNAVLNLFAAMAKLDLHTHLRFWWGRGDGVRDQFTRYKKEFTYTICQRVNPGMRLEKTVGRIDGVVPITCPKCAVFADKWLERGFKGKITIRRAKALSWEIETGKRKPKKELPDALRKNLFQKGHRKESNASGDIKVGTLAPRTWPDFGAKP